MIFKATQTFVGLSLFFSITALAADPATPANPVVLLHESYSTGVGGNATVQGALNKVLDAQAKNLADLQALKTTLSDERAVTSALHQTADALNSNTKAISEMDKSIRLETAKHEWVAAQDIRIRVNLTGDPYQMKGQLSAANERISNAEYTIANLTSPRELDKFKNGFVLGNGGDFLSLSDDSLLATRSVGAGSSEILMDLNNVVKTRSTDSRIIIERSKREKQLLEVETKRLSTYKGQLEQPTTALTKVQSELEKAKADLLDSATKFQATLKDGKRLEKTVVIELSKEEQALVKAAEKDGIVGEGLMAKILKARGIGTGMAVVGIAATGYFIYESAQAKETQWVSTDASAKLKHVSQGPALLDESPVAVGHSAKSDLL